MKLQETRRYQLLSLFIALVITLTMNPIKAQAQIIGSLEADIIDLEAEVHEAALGVNVREDGIDG